MQVRDPLHTVTAEEKKVDVRFLPSEVYDQLLGFGGCYVGNQSNKDTEKQAVLNHIILFT